jgi:tetratricopeptide (TPR) repeat protein
MNRSPSRTVLVDEPFCIPNNTIQAEGPQSVQDVHAAHAIFVDDVSHDHEEIAINLDNIGIACGMLGKLQTAKELLEESLQIKERLFGRHHEKTYVTIYNLALVRQQFHDFEGARDLLEEVVGFREVYCGTRNDPAVAEALYALAENLLALGYRRKARTFFDEVLCTYRDFFGNNSEPVANTLLALHDTEEDIDKRKSTLLESLDILEYIYGPNAHVSKCNVKSALAYIMGQCGDYQGKIDMLQEVILTREEAYATRRRPQISMDLFQLASAMAFMGRHEESKEILKEVLGLQKVMYGTIYNVNISRTMNNFANVVAVLGDNKTAKTILEEVIHIQERIYGTKEHPDVARTMFNLARNLHMLGDDEGMKEIGIQCLMIQERLGNRRAMDVPLIKMK